MRRGIKAEGKGRGTEGGGAPQKIHPIGVLILQAFDLYLPWMNPADIAEILTTGTLPSLATIATWEVARSIWETTAKTGKKTAETADKPQRENAVQNEGDAINW